MRFWQVFSKKNIDVPYIARASLIIDIANIVKSTLKSETQVCNNIIKLSNYIINIDNKLTLEIEKNNQELLKQFDQLSKLIQNSAILRNNEKIMSMQIKLAELDDKI